MEMRIKSVTLKKMQVKGWYLVMAVFEHDKGTILFPKLGRTPREAYAGALSEARFYRRAKGGHRYHVVSY